MSEKQSDQTFSVHAARYGATVKYAPGDVTILPEEATAETVTLSSVNPNAEIYYTLDGSAPQPKETSTCHRYSNSISIEMTNGVPCVRWTPDLNEDGAKELRTYKIWGKETLDDTSDWEYPTNSLHHFFKVTVEMK